MKSPLITTASGRDAKLNFVFRAFFLAVLRVAEGVIAVREAALISRRPAVKTGRGVLRRGTPHSAAPQAALFVRAWRFAPRRLRALGAQPVGTPARPWPARSGPPEPAEQGTRCLSLGARSGLSQNIHPTRPPHSAPLRPAPRPPPRTPTASPPHRARPGRPGPHDLCVCTARRSPCSGLALSEIELFTGRGHAGRSLRHRQGSGSATGSVSEVDAHQGAAGAHWLMRSLLL